MLGRQVQARAGEPYEALAPLYDRGQALDRATIALTEIGGVDIGTGAARWIVERLRGWRAATPTTGDRSRGLAW